MLNDFLTENVYPSTDLANRNLDFMIRDLQKMMVELKTFVSINSVKYADPIRWDITRQYEKNTIVIDPLTGTAYISVAAVPIGVALTRTEYWTPVFDLEQFVTKGAKNFTSRFEEQTTLTATFPTPVNGWLVWNSTLYRALTNIVAGDQYTPDSNIKEFTMEDVIGHPEDVPGYEEGNNVCDLITGLYNFTNEAVNLLFNFIGDLSDLTTEDKTSLVSAINELVSKFNNIDEAVGDLSNLSTTDKTSIVNAINEVSDVIGDINTLDTTDKTSIVNAINEVFNKPAGTWATPQWYGAIGDGITDDSDAFIELFASEHNIVIPDGEYLITKQILLQDNTIVLCNGKILDRYSPNINGLFYANNKHNIIIKGLNIEGSGYNRNADYSGHAQFYINNCDNVIIDSCSVKNTQVAYPIWCFHSTHVTIINNKINGCAYGCIGLYNDCSDSQILYNTVENFGNTVMDRGYGIVCSGYDTEIPQSRPNNIKCIGNTVINTNEIWEGIESHGCDHIIISDNYVKGCISGITIFKRHISESIVDACIITNNHIIGVDNCDIAIRVFDHKNGIISGNTIEHYSNRSTGSNIYGAIDIRDSENITINANILNDVGNSVSANNKLQAVFYVQSSSNVKICDNECYHCSARYVFYLYDNIKGINIKNNHGIIDYAARLLREYMSAAPDYNTYNYFLDNVMDGANDIQFTGYIVCSPNYRAIYSNTKSGCAGDIMVIQDASSNQNCVYLCTASKVGATDAVWIPIVTLPE